MLLIMRGREICLLKIVIQNFGENWILSTSCFGETIAKYRTKKDMPKMLYLFLNILPH